MLIPYTQKDLTDAKQEIIVNLKKEIDDAKQSCNQQSQSAVTSNAVVPSEERDRIIEITNHYDEKIRLMTEEMETLKTKLNADAEHNNADPEKKYSGLKETCEFLNIHGANGIVMNGFLVWANIQRMSKPVNNWKEEALSKFVKEEITEAKECLWRTCGDSIPTPMKKRQGASKSNSEVNDICGALTSLGEKERLPIFLATSEMVKETPIYMDLADENSTEKEIKSRLEGIESTMKTILDKTTATNNRQEDESREQVNSRRISPVKPVISDTPKNRTVTWAEEEDVYMPPEEDVDIDPHSEWENVPPRGSKKRSWKEKLNIVQGTGNDDTVGSADVDLVAYGVRKDVSAVQISQYLINKGLDVKSCDLLTKFQGARSLAYKITIKKSDMEKASAADMWPGGVGVRKFKHFSNQRRNNEQKKHPNKAYPKHGNKWADPSFVPRNTHSIWNPPSNELVAQYQNQHLQNRQTDGNQGRGQQYSIPDPSQRVLYRPPIWNSQQHIQNVQEVEQPQLNQQPQMTILQRNGKDLFAGNQIKQVLQPDAGMMAAWGNGMTPDGCYTGI